MAIAQTIPGPTGEGAEAATGDLPTSANSQTPEQLNNGYLDDKAVVHLAVYIRKCTGGICNIANYAFLCKKDELKVGFLLEQLWKHMEFKKGEQKKENVAILSLHSAPCRSEISFKELEEETPIEKFMADTSESRKIEVAVIVDDDKLKNGPYFPREDSKPIGATSGSKTSSSSQSCSQNSRSPGKATANSQPTSSVVPDDASSMLRNTNRWIPPGGDKNLANSVDSNLFASDQKPSTSGAGYGDSALTDRRARDDNNRCYVGLVNQAMTCYLNSLLQTLYMTPEFRNTLYKWKFEGSEESASKSIPYQLQKLFLLLQTSAKESLETKDLTKSFGWDSNDAFDQHDVQELCRVMFDALEMIWRKKEGKNAPLIQDMYQGLIKDYVKCLECQVESAKEVIFLDLQLAVKPFGATAAYRSVDEALDAFVQPEVLEGSNQYDCERCKKKCDAHKGLKFTRLPYLLTLQLKRFDFDYTTLHRIKLNDRMVFSDILNMNRFVAKDSSDSSCSCSSAEPCVSNLEQSQKRSKLASVPEENEVPDIPTAAGGGDFSDVSLDEIPRGQGTILSDDEGISLNDSACSPSTGSPVDAGDDVFSEQEFQGFIDRQLVEKALKQGPYVYELFSIMVHSGSASGGHYYAYIKNMDQGTWFCFNDQRVSTATLEEIQKTFGTGSGTTWSWASNTNAYMLMYRQIDKNRNDSFVRNQELPSHLMDLLKVLEEEEERKRVQKEYEDSLVELFAYYVIPGDGQLKCVTFSIPQTKSIAELLVETYKETGLETVTPPVPIERCRLVKFETCNKSFCESFKRGESRSIKVLFPWGLKHNIFLEWRTPDEEFREYGRDGTTLNIIPVELPEGVLGPVVYKWVPQDATVGQIQELIAKYYGTEAGDVRLAFYMGYSKTLRLLDNPEKKFSAEQNFLACKVVELMTDSGLTTSEYVSDRKLPFENSEFCQAINRAIHVKEYKVVMPSAADFQRLKIPLPHFVAVKEEEGQDESEPKNGKISFTPSPVIVGTQRKDSDSEGVWELPSLYSNNRWTELSGGRGFVSAKSLMENKREHSAYKAACSSRSPEGGDSLPDSPNPSPQVSPVANGDCTEETRGNGFPFSEKEEEKGSEPSVYKRLKQNSAEEEEKKPHHPIPPPPPPPPTVPVLARNSNLSPADSESERRSQKDQNEPVDEEDWDEEFEDEKKSREDREIEKKFRKDSVSMFCKIMSYGEEQGRTVLSLNVDERMTYGGLKYRLSEVLGGLEVAQFSLCKMHGCGPNFSEYEIKDESLNLATANAVAAISVKLGRPLKDGEFLLKVLRFCSKEKEENWPHIFDMVASDNMNATDLYEQAHRMLAETCGENVPTEKLRLRIAESGNLDILERRKLVKEAGFHFGGYTRGRLVLQILEERDPLIENPVAFQSLFVRRWYPGTMSLGVIQEILIRCKIGFKKTKEEISRISKIPVERLELSQGSVNGKFPYEEERLSLLEQVQFRKEMPHDDHPVYRDGQLFYYRNSEERPKKLTAEERKEIQIKDNANQRRMASSYIQRRERALKIYTELSTSIADEDLD